MEIENCQMRGQVSQGSRYWMKNHPMKFHGLGGDGQECKRPPDLTLCGQRDGKICRRRRSEGKRKSGPSKNRSSTVLENCVEFTSMIQQMKNSRIFWRNARRKLEVPMPAAMLCTTRREEYRETCRGKENCKTKYACNVEADESTRKRLKGTLHKGHDDHFAGRGVSSLNHYNLVHKFIPMPQANENARCQSCSGKKEWE